jgi:catechol 2,3-dioxygenase-like lactoylglutathione lyase family enzyme
MSATVRCRTHSIATCWAPNWSGLDAKPVARIPVPPGGSDLCFEWPGTIGEAVAHLDRCGVPIDRGPQQGFGAKGLGDSVYFRDPDGTLLEFICYPAN